MEGGQVDSKGQKETFRGDENVLISTVAGYTGVYILVKILSRWVHFVINVLSFAFINKVDFLKEKTKLQI